MATLSKRRQCGAAFDLDHRRAPVARVGCGSEKDVTRRIVGVHPTIHGGHVLEIQFAHFLQISGESLRQRFPGQVEIPPDQKPRLIMVSANQERNVRGDGRSVGVERVAFGREPPSTTGPR
jgi:hypothetical protein